MAYTVLTDRQKNTITKQLAAIETAMGIIRGTLDSAAAPTTESPKATRKPGRPRKAKAPASPAQAGDIGG